MVSVFLAFQVSRHCQDWEGARSPALPAPSPPRHPPTPPSPPSASPRSRWPASVRSWSRAAVWPGWRGENSQTPTLSVVTVVISILIGLLKISINFQSIEIQPYILKSNFTIFITHTFFLGNVSLSSALLFKKHNYNHLFILHFYDPT